MTSNDEGYDWDREFRRELARKALIARVLPINQLHYEHKALEEMVERMLTSPERCGIAVVITHQTEFTPEPESPNLYRSIQQRQYRLDPHVPFGTLYEFPSVEAYEIWYERGCPEAV